MVKTRIPFRFVFDSNFFNNLGSKDKLTLSSVLVNLMYINNDSILYKWAHNLISKKSFDAINKEIANPLIFHAALKLVEEPNEIESIEDEITRTLKYVALYEATIPKPNEVYLFTSKEKVSEYKNSETNSEIKGDVTIFIDEVAINEIKYWYEEVKDIDHDSSNNHNNTIATF